MFRNLFRKRFNLDKELKKVQKKGIYNPKVKMMSIIGIALLTVGLGVSFSLFSYSSGDIQAYNSKINKVMKVKVNIENGSLKTLAAKILADNEIQDNPTFTNSHTDEGLFVQSGDSTKSVDGDPTYYFRGEVDNNYVSFAGSIWRIVRINEDGTVRLISNEKELAKNSSYNSTNSTTYSGSLVATSVNNWYNSLASEYKEYIAQGTFCNDTTNTASSRYNTNATFVCPSNAKSLKLYAGLISGDEVIYAGASHSSYSPTYLNISSWYWTMTAADSSNMYIGLNNGLWNYTSATTGTGRDVRPVINIKAEAMYDSGDGTASNPYKISGVTEDAASITLTPLYNEKAEVEIYPNVGLSNATISCENNQTASYDLDTNTFSITPTEDTTCTITFEEKILNIKLPAFFDYNLASIVDYYPEFTKDNIELKGSYYHIKIPVDPTKELSIDSITVWNDTYYVVSEKKYHTMFSVNSSGIQDHEISYEDDEHHYHDDIDNSICRVTENTDVYDGTKIDIYIPKLNSFTSTDSLVCDLMDAYMAYQVQFNYTAQVTGPSSASILYEHDTIDGGEALTEKFFPYDLSGGSQNISTYTQKTLTFAENISGITTGTSNEYVNIKYSGKTLTLSLKKEILPSSYTYNSSTKWLNSTYPIGKGGRIWISKVLSGEIYTTTG